MVARVIDPALSAQVVRSVGGCGLGQGCPMTWLWSQFQDFSLGVAAISFAFGLVGFTRMLWNDPKRTAARLGGSIAWFFTLLAILWVATQYL